MFKWLNTLINRNYDLTNAAYTNQLLGLFGNTKSKAGVSVTPYTALSLPALYKGVDLISSTIGRTSCRLFERLPNNSRELAKEHDFYNPVRRRPNQLVNSFNFFKSLVHDAIIAGNGYAYIDRNNFKLVNISADFVTPYVTEGLSPEIVYKVQFQNAKEFYLMPDEVLHIKSVSGGNALVGYRLVDVLKEAIGLGIATQQYGAVYFKNNGSVSNVIELPNGLKDEEAIRKFRAGFDEQHAGIDNSFKTVLLQNGAKLNRVQINNNEAQFIESRQASLVDVANCLGLPAHKLNSQISTSYSSIEAENLALLSDCYLKWFINIAQELDNKLLTEKEKYLDSHYFEFDVSELQKGDTNSETTTAINKLNNGLWSWEETRSYFNLTTDKDDSQEWRQPSNIVIVGETPPEPPPVSLPNPGSETQTEPENEGEQGQDTTERFKPILKAELERLLTRLGKSNQSLAEHELIFNRALPNCEEFVARFFASIKYEYENILPEQREKMINNLDSEKLFGDLWNSVIRK